MYDPTTSTVVHVTNASCLILLKVTSDALSSIRFMLFKFPKTVKSEYFPLGRTCDHVTSWSNTYEARSSGKTLLLIVSSQ